MSTSTFISNRRAVPVNIGTMQLYCESMVLSAKRAVSEASTVSGSGTVTNTSPRCADITLKGRAFNEEQPLHSAAVLDSLLRSSTALTVQYRGLIFNSCRILTYEVTDSGRDYADISVSLSSAGVTEPETEER